MIDDPAGWPRQWAEQVGSQLKGGPRQGPGFIAFVRERGLSTTRIPDGPTGQAL